MRTLLVFIVGIAVGIALWHFIRSAEPGPERTDLEARSAAALNRARAEARELGDRMSAQLREWNLSPDVIKRELSETGRIIRNKARQAGARIDDARVVAMINAKFVLDDQLAASDLNVECRQGQVTIRGSAPSDEAIAQAVALALETEGVTNVTAEVAVKRPGE